MGILTNELVNEAIDLALSSISSIMKITRRNYQSAEKPQMHVTVIAPRIPGVPPGTIVEVRRSFGDIDTWPKDFEKISISKSEITYFTGHPTAIAQTMPQYLQEGDTLYFGSVIVNGIVVGVSGWEPEIDEMLAGIIAYWIQMLCKMKAVALHDAGESFVE
jgi:hypothetical protein